MIYYTILYYTIILYSILFDSILFYYIIIHYIILYWFILIYIIKSPQAIILRVEFACSKLLQSMHVRQQIMLARSLLARICQICTFGYVCAASLALLLWALSLWALCTNKQLMFHFDWDVSFRVGTIHGHQMAGRRLVCIPYYLAQGHTR